MTTKSHIELDPPIQQLKSERHLASTENGTYSLDVAQDSSQASGSRQVLSSPQPESRSEPGELHCQSDN